jgi:hypothetical protein
MPNIHAVFSHFIGVYGPNGRGNGSGLYVCRLRMGHFGLKSPITKETGAPKMGAPARKILECEVP